MEDLKLTFANKALVEYNERVIAGIKAMAVRMKVGITNDAINSLAYKTIVNNSTGSAISNLSFKEYLRFIDMGVGRGHPLGGIKAMRVTLSNKSTGYAQKKDNGRKAKKVYSKVAYGNLTWLQNNLIYGYTEETRIRLKSEMENK